MSGRVHDLITAENFAKWAEERASIDRVPGRTGDICAMARFFQHLGFPNAHMGQCTYLLNGLTGEAIVAARWMCLVVRAFDHGERSGPALAKLARENA